MPDDDNHIDDVDDYDDDDDEDVDDVVNGGDLDDTCLWDLSLGCCSSSQS